MSGTTVTLSPQSIELLRKIGESYGSSSIEDALGHVIGSQAAIVDAINQGNQVVIRDHPGKLVVSKPLSKSAW